MIKAAVGPDQVAILIYDPSYAAEHGLEVFEFPEIPEGCGTLKTDGTRLWWEAFVPPEPPAQEALTNEELTGILRQMSGI